MTPNLVVKVSPFFDTEYLTNGYRYGHSYYRKGLGNRNRKPYPNFQMAPVSMTMTMP